VKPALILKRKDNNMEKELRELLLKDLSARFPYGVICKVEFKDSEGWKAQNMSLKGVFINECYFTTDIGSIYSKEFKPYLRPMSSMTKEEKKDILQSLNIYGDIDNEGNLLLGVECNIITLKVCKKYLGELNKRMFDVCHMIEKGFALKAPEGMYNIK
jgi:hypothetical protein